MFKKQSGATLAMVLVFLLILTILAVTSMSSSIIQQKSATNMYLESESFHLADSAIASLINADKLNTRAFYGTTFEDEVAEYDSGTDTVNAVKPYFCVGSDGKVFEKDDKASCSGTDYNGISGIKAIAQIEYLGCLDCPGNEVGGLIGCNAWKISGFGEVSETSTVIDHWVVKTAGCASNSNLPNNIPNI